MNEMRTTSRKTRVGKVVSDKMDKTIVVIEADIGTVIPADTLGAANDDSLDHLALLDSAAGLGLTDRRHDDVADVAELPGGTAQDADALDLLGAGIIGNLQIRL